MTDLGMRWGADLRQRYPALSAECSLAQPANLLGGSLADARRELTEALVADATFRKLVISQLVAGGRLTWTPAAEGKLCRELESLCGRTRPLAHISPRAICLARDAAAAGELLPEWTLDVDRLGRELAERILGGTEAGTESVGERGEQRAGAIHDAAVRVLPTLHVAALQRAGAEAQRQLIAWCERELRRAVELPELRRPLVVLRVTRGVLDAAAVDVAGRCVGHFQAKVKEASCAAQVLELGRLHDATTLVVVDGQGRGEALAVCEQVARESGGKWLVEDDRGADWWSETTSARDESPAESVAVRALLFVARRLQSPLTTGADVPAVELLPRELRRFLDESGSKELEDSLDRLVAEHGLDFTRAGARSLARIAGLGPLRASQLHRARLAGAATASEAGQRLGWKPEVTAGVPVPISTCGASVGPRSPIPPLTVGQSAPLAETDTQHASAEPANGAPKPLCGDPSCSLSRGGDQPDSPSTSNAGHESAGDESAGDESAGDESAGHESAGHESAGHESAGHESAGHVFRDRLARLEELSCGQVHWGVVRRIGPLGAHVDIGAATDALLHISQMGRGFVADGYERWGVGSLMSVEVERVESERGRIGVVLAGARNRGREGAPRRGKQSGDTSLARQDRRGGRGRVSPSSGASRGGASSGPSQAADATRRNLRSADTGAGSSKTRQQGGRGNQGGDRSERASGTRSRGSRPPVPPPAITPEMADGREPLRSFSDLRQFLDQRRDEPVDETDGG